MTKFITFQMLQNEKMKKNDDTRLIVIGCLFANVLKLNIIDGNASNGN